MSERQIEKVGPLSFCRSDLIGYGKFGTVFKGQYKNAVNLAVKRFEKKNTKSAQQMQVLQRKLDSYQRRLRALEAQSITHSQNQRAPKQGVLRGVGMGIK